MNVADPKGVLRIVLKVIIIKLSRPDVPSYCVVRSQAREQGLATMLFCVVAVFFVCNLLALVVNILEVGTRKHISKVDLQGESKKSVI